MAFSISKFRGGALSKSGARANLFEVTLTGSAAGSFAVNTKEFQFACKAAAIPAMAVGVVEVPYFGRVVKVPGNKTFDNWTTTVINDEGFEVRNAMEKWMTAMGTHAGNVSTATEANLYGSADVRQHAKKGGIIQTYTFVKIFPVSIGEITLGWGENDTIEEFPVEFAYDYWTHSAATGGAIVT